MKSALVRFLILMLPLYLGIVSNLHQLHKLPGFRQYSESIFDEYKRYQLGENK